MKNLYIPFLLILFAFCSCLDESPRDQVDESEIYTDASAVYTHAVASLYGYFGSNTEGEGLQGTCRGIYDFNTLTTDEALNPVRGGDWYDGGLWQNLRHHTWTKDETCLYNIWTYLYKVIGLCNHSLAVIDAHADLLTDRQNAEYQAEVRAVRALFYYYTMDLFGSVPLVTSEEETAENIRQATRSETFRFCVAELQEVLPLLPNQRSNRPGDYYGRITRPVIYFVLAKLALNAEIYSDDNPTDGQKTDGKNLSFTVEGQTLNAWQACVYYCNLLEAFGYELENDFSANFAVNNETSAENILTIPCDKLIYTNEYHYLFRSRHYSHGGAYGTASENGTSATISTVRAFGYGTDEVDNRFSLSFYADTVWVDGVKVMLDNGQPLVYYPLEVSENVTDSPYRFTAGARTFKYEVDRTAYADGRLPNNDIVLFRYADVLLMKAEAQLRNGEDGSAALNAVRTRAGMPSVECTLDNILRERLLELVWEGWRRQDLIRFGRFTEAYDGRERAGDEDSGFTTVFPIPQKCIDLNNRLTQNPGY